MRFPTILLTTFFPLLTFAVALPGPSDCTAGPIPTTTTTKTVYNDKRTASSDCSIPTTTITKTVYNDKRNPTTTTNPSSARETYMVKVGGRGDDGKPILKYDPETVNAKAGDIVKFNFLLANHTVTQSSFDTPCTGLDGGFRTGVQSNPGSVDGLIIKEFVVVDEKPVWFYCGFGTHCQAGMVFSINPGNKFDEFKSKAKASPPKGSPSGSGNGSSGTAPTEPVTHIVIVGGLSNDGKTPMLRYTPDNVIAKPGDKILFDFKAANHTVTQSSFEQPCQALDGGFKSGVRMNPTDITGLSMFQIDVKDDKPIWVYCGVGTHCQQGMVFSVNAGNKLSAFQAAAKKSATRSP